MPLSTVSKGRCSEDNAGPRVVMRHLPSAIRGWCYRYGHRRALAEVAASALTRDSD